MRARSKSISIDFNSLEFHVKTSLSKVNSWKPTETCRVSPLASSLIAQSIQTIRSAGPARLVSFDQQDSGKSRMDFGLLGLNSPQKTFYVIESEGF
jgi:hypothetical protein